jgi:hypothetical protein
MAIRSRVANHGAIKSKVRREVIALESIKEALEYIRYDQTASGKILAIEKSGNQ